MNWKRFELIVSCLLVNKSQILTAKVYCTDSPQLDDERAFSKGNKKR